MMIPILIGIALLAGIVGVFVGRALAQAQYHAAQVAAGRAEEACAAVEGADLPNARLRLDQVEGVAVAADTCAKRAEHVVEDVERRMTALEQAVNATFGMNLRTGSRS